MKKLLSTMAIILSMMLLFTGCGSKDDGSKVVEEMFECIKTLEFEKAEKCFVSKDIGISEKSFEELGAKGDIIKKLLENIDYEVLSVETVDENKSIVHTNIKTIDTKQLILDFVPMVINHVIDAFPEIGNGKDIDVGLSINEDFNSLMINPQYARYQSVVDIMVVKDKESWKIELDEPLVKMLYKNVTDAFSELENTLTKIQENVND